MTSLYKLTKEELVAKCKRLQSENERLEDELNRLSDCYTELENESADAVNALNDENIVKDVDQFKFRLQLEGLWTSQMESFIEYYLRYHNGRRG